MTDIDDGTPVPNWWQDPDMPADGFVIIKWFRDGQARVPFENAEIVGEVMNPEAPRRLLMLENLIRFITSPERPEQLLQQVLYLADSNITGGASPIDEIRGLEGYREFVNGRLQAPSRPCAPM